MGEEEDAYGEEGERSEEDDEVSQPHRHISTAA
jgi:hypothetical protein